MSKLSWQIAAILASPTHSESATTVLLHRFDFLSILIYHILINRRKFPEIEERAKVYITQSLYARETGRCAMTVCARLKTVPPHHTGQHGQKYYHVAACLPTLYPREYESVRALVLCSDPSEDSLYVGGPEALSMARDFIAWLPEEARDRLSAAQNSFVVALANSNICAAPVVENIENLRVLIVLQPDVLRWIFRCGDAPDIDRIGPAFAIVNNHTYEVAA